MMTQKIIKVLFVPLLFIACQSAQATKVVLNPDQCHPGTTAAFLGFGFISGGEFFRSHTSPGNSVYRCKRIPSFTAENSFQIQRSTSNTINQHIMEKVVREYSTDTQINKGAASADSDNYNPDAVWGETNLSSLTEHDKTPGFASNIYQFTAGLDKRQGDFFYGAAVTYAYTDNNLVADTDNVMHTVGITPYIAYKINDYLFASGLASYYYSNTSHIAGTRDINTHDYQGEANINTFKVIDAFTLKGRAGVRYKHTSSSQKGGAVGRDNTFDEIVGIVDGQIDYKFESGLTLFTGVLYNHYAREASRISTLVTGEDVVWMRYGAEYPVTKGFVIGAKIENDLNDKQTNYLTGSLNFRLDL